MKKIKINNNILKFEGEYLYGKRHGKGKDYDFNGKIIYEGEYINGKRKEFYDKKYKYLLLFEGELLNGEKSGKMYNSDFARRASMINNKPFELVNY